MNFYYGPGDLLGIYVDHRMVNSLLSTFTMGVSTPLSETRGLGEKWDRVTPLGVRKGTANQDGWLPQEIRDLFRQRNQLKARSLLILPTGGAGREAVLMTGEVAASVDYGSPKDDLVGATITWGVSGEVVDSDLYAAGFVERLSPEEISGGDRDPVAGSLTTLQAATIGATSAAGGTLYMRLPEATLTLHRLYLAITSDLAETDASRFVAFGSFTAAGSQDVVIASGTSIPAALRFIARFVPTVRMRVRTNAAAGATSVLMDPEDYQTAAAANAGATSVAVDRGAVPFLGLPGVGTRFRFAGSTTVHTVAHAVADKAAASTAALTLHFSPALPANVANNTQITVGDAATAAAARFQAGDKFTLRGATHTVQAGGNIPSGQYNITPALPANVVAEDLALPDTDPLVAENFVAALRRN